MRSFSSTAAALLALLALAAGGADAQSCELPAKTLTYKCSECTANVPCWYNTTTTAATSACKSVCMTGVYDQIKTFSLIVPFGTWKSAQELAEPVPLPASTVNTLASYSFINNNYLDTFDVMDLPATSTKIAISGGTSLGVNVKGHVSNVKLAPTLAANASGVTIVWLLNLNLQPQADDIAQMLPPKIQYLALDNGLLSDFPKGISSLTSLKALFFRTNYVKSVDSTAGLDGLSELWLSENNIESFTAVFPKLQVLDLALNNLPQFPKVLAKYSALQTLWYYNNSVTEVAKDAPLPSSLTTLSLYNNKISSFEAVLPSLTSLDLSNNDLTEIPPVVFTFSSLTLLKLSGNKMKNVSLTTEQASFLVNLKNFTFDTTATFKDCFTSQQKAVQGVPFCIADVSSKSNDGDDGGKKNKSSSTALIVGIAAGAVVFVVFIITIVMCRRKRSRDGKDFTLQDGTTTNGTNGTATTSLWYDSALLSVKVNAEDIEDIKTIGKGAYGDVWLVKYRRTQLLASKRLRKSEATHERTKCFIEEIKLVAKLEHPNIVPFVGAAWTIEADLQALFEYMEGGDLRDYLASDYTPRTWSPAKVQIAIDVVEALVYVHSFSPPLVHRDLKSRNVLLSSELQAKLTDFGVSRFRSVDNTMTAGVGTGKWLAPEVIAGATDYGSAADIFSFGAVLVELDTHKLPYDEVRGPNGAKVADVALLQMIASGQVRPRFSQSCPEKIAEIGNRCFALNPSERPAAAEIAYALRQLKKGLYR